MFIETRPLHAVLLTMALIALILSGCGRDGAPSTLDTSPALSLAQGDDVKGEPAPEKAVEPEKETQAAGPPPPNVDLVLVGDQVTLYWDSMNPGDYNSDGTVNGLDVFPLAAHFDEDVIDTPGNECVDGNQDSHLDGLDLFTIAVNFQNRIDGVDVFMDDEEAGPFDGAALNTALIAYGGCYEQQEFSYDINPYEPSYFVIRAYDEVAEEHSAPSGAVRPEVLPVVDGLNWRGGSLENVLGWQPWSDPYGDFDYWHIQRKRQEDGSWTGWTWPYYLNDPDPIFGLVLCNVSNLDNDVTYSWRVKGYNTSGLEGEWTEIRDAVATTYPGGPSNLSALNQGDSVLLLMNRSHSFGRAGYNVYRAEAEEGPFVRVDQPEPFSRLPATFTPPINQWDIWYIDDSIEPGTDYWYQVRTVNESRNESTGDAVVQALATGAPSIPTGLTADHVPMSSSIDLDWNDNPEPEVAGYNVWQSADGWLPYVKLNEELVTESSYRDHDVVDGERWYYLVTAVSDTEAQSGMSDPVTYDLLVSNWWSMTVEDNSTYGDHHAITFNGDDQPLVAYRVASEDELRVAEYNGVGGWDYTLIDSGGGAGHELSMDWDPDGILGLCYAKDDDNTLWLAEYDGSWSTSLVTTAANTIGDTSLTYDANENPYIAYLVEQDWTLKLVHWDGSDWEEEHLAAGVVGLGEVKIVFPDSPIIAYRTSSVYLTQYDGAWNSWQVPDTSDCSYIDFVLDGMQNPVVAFSKNLSRQARWFDGVDSWDSYVVHDPPGNLNCGGYSAMTTDNWGNPVGCHKDYGGPALVYYRWTGSEWDWFPVSRQNMAATDISTDSNGWPAISVQRVGGPLWVYRYEE